MGGGGYMGSNHSIETGEDMNQSLCFPEFLNMNHLYEGRYMWVSPDSRFLACAGI